MAKIFMSEEAIRDLEQIGDYIAHQFKCPRSALNTIQKIQERISQLEDFPLISAQLSAIVATKRIIAFWVVEVIWHFTVHKTVMY